MQTATSSGIDLDLILNEPRRRRLRSNLDLDESDQVSETKPQKVVSRSSSVESSRDSQGNQ